MRYKLAGLVVMATLAVNVMGCVDKGDVAVKACQVACESTHEGNQGRIDTCCEACEDLLVPETD